MSTEKTNFSKKISLEIGGPVPSQFLPCPFPVQRLAEAAPDAPAFWQTPCFSHTRSALSALNTPATGPAAPGQAPPVQGKLPLKGCTRRWRREFRLLLVCADEARAIVRQSLFTMKRLYSRQAISASRAAAARSAAPGAPSFSRNSSRSLRAAARAVFFRSVSPPWSPSLSGVR